MSQQGQLGQCNPQGQIARPGAFVGDSCVSFTEQLAGAFLKSLVGYHAPERKCVLARASALIIVAGILYDQRDLVLGSERQAFLDVSDLPDIDVAIWHATLVTCPKTTE